MAIRVGRRTKEGDPSVTDYVKILCLTPSTPYGDLGPYSLKDEHGHLMENIWQARFLCCV